MANNKIFETVKIDRPKQNVFDLSHEVKLSFNMGELIPFLCKEVLPSDKFIVDSQVLVRLQPLLAPVMHRVDVYTHFFFVPNRILEEDWEEFITGGEDGLATCSIPIIHMDDANKDSFVKGRLGDYLGIPVYDGSTAVLNTYALNCLPFRAYLAIYNEYYRDQNLTPEISLISNTDTLTTVRKRAWEKDYFTSALPWTQRGSEVELSGAGSVKLLKAGQHYRDVATDIVASGVVVGANLSNPDGLLMAGGTNPLWYDANVDMAAVTINELRRVTKLQEWLESMARGGSRYTEQLLHMFGVKSSDARLQRPEYLGGGKQPVVISEVINQSGVRQHNTDVIIEPQGSMSGHGLSIGSSNKFSERFEEHGLILGIISVLPRTAYSQGIDKMFTRVDKEDYYWTQFSQLGEQEIDIKEIYADYYSAQPDEIFGYQQRYAEYKHQQDRVCGDFRDDFNYWHLAREFTTKPTLNTAFIECDASHRIFAVTDPVEHKLFCQIYNKVKAVRPIPYFNIPTI